MDYSLKFDGSQNYVIKTGCSPAFSTSSISFGGWFKLPTTALQDYGHLISVGGGDQAILYYYKAGDAVSCKFGFSSFDTPVYSSPPKNRPFHIVITYDGSSTVTAYVNGSPTTYSLTTSISYNNNNFLSGSADGQWNGSFYNGGADDLFAYNGVLSQAQVSNIYQNRVYPSSNMVVLWKLNEGSGTTANDSANSNNGTLTGSPVPSWVSGLDIVGPLPPFFTF